LGPSGSSGRVATGSGGVKLVSGQAARRSVQLICMDALCTTPGNDSDLGQIPDGWSPNATRLLAHARSQGWSVGHVIPRRPKPGETPWRPALGLAPLPCEPVYHRDQPSVFSSAELCAALDRHARADVVLCGVSVDGSCLASALDAVLHGRRLTIAADATAIATIERQGVEGLLSLQHLGLAGRMVRMTAIHTLVGLRRELRLVQGGRA